MRETSNDEMMFMMGIRKPTVPDNDLDNKNNAMYSEFEL